MDTNILSSERGLTFWRPKPPIGYASLGDCVTTGTAQPSFQVRPGSPHAQIGHNSVPLVVSRRGCKRKWLQQCTMSWP